MISGHVCKDCGVNVIAAGELYMADLALWKRFGMTRWDAICVDCFEERLGRRLDPGDFITTPGD